MKGKVAWDKKSMMTEEKKKYLNPKVLVVEDNQLNVLPIKTTLKRNHIDFDLAKNGLIAVEKFNQTQLNK